MSIPVPPPPFSVKFTTEAGSVASQWQRYLLASQQLLTTGTAPIDAQYWIATANASLTAERNLGALSSGYVKAAVAAGVAVPSTTATIPATDLSGTIPTANFPDPLPALSGVNLTSLTAGNLVGSLPAISGAALTALPDPLPALSGANLTALNGSAISSGTVAAARLPLVLTSGTYTPTLTGVVNVAASTAYVCQYLRVGSVVTVSGQVDIDPTAAGDTQLGLSLPVASVLTTPEQCAGSAISAAVAGQCAAILGDVVNARAQVQWIAVDTANRAMMFSFVYLVI